MTATTVFVTGDRSMPEPIALAVAGHIVTQLATAAALEGGKVQFATGDNIGFEQGFRAIADAMGLPTQVVPTGVDPDTSKPAWDTRHEVVNAIADRVLLVHTDPLASSIGKSLQRVAPDKLDLYNPMPA